MNMLYFHFLLQVPMKRTYVWIPMKSVHHVQNVYPAVLVYLMATMCLQEKFGHNIMLSATKIELKPLNNVVLVSLILKTGSAVHKWEQVKKINLNPPSLTRE